MVIDECAHLSPETVCERVGHLPRSERDTQERPAARERQACKSRVDEYHIRESRIRDVPARLREACTGVLAARAPIPRYALPR